MSLKNFVKKYQCILLVDDDDVSNMLTEIEIKTSGLSENVEIAYDGAEGLSKLKEFLKDKSNNLCPELILLDISMPVMGGFEFLQEFNELDFDHKPGVVILTSSRNPKDIARSNTFNIIGFLNKPFSAYELQTIIQNRA
jgi:CheY-like chemotaxis protein